MVALVFLLVLPQYNGKHQVASLQNKFSEYVTPESASDDESAKVIKAALESHAAIVSLLIEKGADVALKDLKGNVAADFDFQGPKKSQDIKDRGRKTSGRRK
jgi:hypothetical protein